MRVDFVVSSDLRCALGDREALRSVLHSVSWISKECRHLDIVVSVEKVASVYFLPNSTDHVDLFAAAMAIMDKHPLAEVDPAAIFRHAFPVPA